VTYRNSGGAVVVLPSHLLGKPSSAYLFGGHETSAKETVPK
jgi:hypothetical protein